MGRFKVLWWVFVLTLLMGSVVAFQESHIQAYYSFAGDATDATGNYDGTVTDATLVTGIGGASNSAYDFDGNGDLINTTLATGDFPNATFAVSFMMRPDVVSAEKYVINEWDTNSGDRTFFMRLQSTNLGRAFLYDSGGTVIHLATEVQGTIDTANAWYHIVLQYNSANKNIELWINNSKVADITGTNPKDTSGIPITLGNLMDGGASGFDGTMDNVVFFNKFLTTTEVGHLYGNNSDVEAMGFFAPVAASYNETIENTIELKNTNTVEINTNVFTTAYSAEFTAPYNSSAYLSANIESYMNFDRTQVCKVTINDTDYSTINSRSMQANNVGNTALFSTNFTVVENSSYLVELQCRRTEPSGKLTINKSNILIHLLSDQNGNEINAQFLNNTYSLSSASYTKVYDDNFTTSNISVGGNIIQNLILDGDISYNYVSASNISVYVVINGSVSPEFKRYGGASSTGSGGVGYAALNISNDASIPIEIWAKSSSGDGSISITGALKEYTTHQYETININVTDETISSSSWSDIKSLYLNNSAHSNYDTMVAASLSTSGTTASTIYYRINVSGQLSEVYSRSVATTNGVSAFQELFENVPTSGNGTITLQAKVDNGTATINGGNILAYLVVEQSATPLVYNVSVYDIWDNTSIQDFNVTTEDGLTYTTTDGIAEITPNGNFDNLTIEIANYYTQYVYNHNTSTNINTSAYQAVISFDAYEIITENLVNPANFTIDATTKTNSQYFYIKAGTYNVTFSGATYFDKVQQVTITGLTNTSVNITDVSGSIINVTAQEYYLGTDINSFSVYINNTQYNYATNYSTTVGWVSVSVIQGTPFTINVTAAGYIDNVTTINSTVTEYNHTAKLYDDSKIIVNFYDEVTLAPITNVTWELYLVNDVGFGLPASTTGTLNNDSISNIPAGFYGIEYTKTNYTVRNYFVLVPFTIGDETNISLYLLESQYATTFVAQVTDRSNQAIEDIYASLLRRYVINNQTQYRVVDMFKPSFALGGTAPFTAEANSVPYLFRINEDDGTLLYQGKGTVANNYETLYLVDTEIFLRINRDQSAFDTYTAFNNVQVTLTNTSGTTFWLSWSDAENELTQICLEVMGNNTNQVYNQCSTASSGVLSYTTDGYNSSYYVARAIGIVASNSQEYIFAIKVLDFREDQGRVLFNILGLFILVLILILAATALAHHPIMAVLVSTFSVVLFGGFMLGIVSISVGILATLVMSALLLIFLLGGRQ